MRLRSIFPDPIHLTPILELGVRAAAKNLRAAIRISEKTILKVNSLLHNSKTKGYEIERLGPLVG
jgi:hypothetical protein